MARRKKSNKLEAGAHRSDLSAKSQNVFIGINIDLNAFQGDLPNTIEEFQRERSREELEALQIAAAISARRTMRRVGTHSIAIPAPDQEVPLKALVMLLPVTASEELKECFPRLAEKFLGITRDVSVSRTVNRLVHSCTARMVGTPKKRKLPIPLYNEKDVDLMLKPLKDLIKELLMIERGNNPKLLRRIIMTCDALKKLGREKDNLTPGPTQLEVAVASNLGADADARAVRKWHEQCDLNWTEWLALCRWYMSNQNQI